MKWKIQEYYGRNERFTSLGKMGGKLVLFLCSRRLDILVLKLIQTNAEKVIVITFTHPPRRKYYMNQSNA